jgi:hypothetical protein
MAVDFTGDGRVGVIDSKAGLEGSSTDVEPKPGVVVVNPGVLLEDMGVKGGDGVVCSGFLKNGESLGVVLLNAPKPTAGRNAEGVVWIFANAPPTVGLGETSTDAALGSGDEGGDMVIGLVGVSLGVVDAAASFEKGEPGVIILFSRGVPNTDVLVATGVAALEGSDLEPRSETEVVGEVDAKAPNPFGIELDPPAERPEVVDPGCLSWGRTQMPHILRGPLALIPARQPPVVALRSRHP